MDQTSNTTIKEPVAGARTHRNNKRKATVTQIDTTAAKLSTHEAICAERYLNLDYKMKTIEDRLDTLELDVKGLRDSMHNNFGEIKQMLSEAKDEKFKTMITVTGSIVVALLGMLGYLVTHIK